MKLPGVRWVIAGLLFVETLLAYLDLQELSVVAPLLGKELGIGNSDYAFITQAFLSAYTITFLLGGLVIDRLGVRRGLALSLFCWSVANALHVLANTPGELAFYRFLLGLAYPGAFLAAARAVAEWYPIHERAFVYGIYVSGATVGAVVAYPMVVWMSAHWNWRAPFLVTGLAGVALAVIWFIAYRRPELHPWITDQEREYVKLGRPQEQSGSGAAWSGKSLLRTRTLWAVAVGRFISDSTWMFYVLWLPKFLTDSQGLSIEQVGRIGWIPFVFADMGSIGGGWLSGYLIRRGAPALRARIALLTVTALVRTFTFVLMMHYPTGLVIAIVSLFVMCTMAWQVNLSVMLVDRFPSRVVATAAGITTGCGTFSTVFFTSAVGWLVDRYSYQPVFVLMSFLSIAAYAAVRLILGRSTIKVSAMGGPTP